MKRNFRPDYFGFGFALASALAEVGSERENKRERISNGYIINIVIAIFFSCQKERNKTCETETSYLKKGHIRKLNQVTCWDVFP